MKSVVEIAVLIIYLAMLGVLVKSPNTSKIATSLGGVFNGSLQTAEHG